MNIIKGTIDIAISFTNSIKFVSLNVLVKKVTGIYILPIPSIIEALFIINDSIIEFILNEPIRISNVTIVAPSIVTKFLCLNLVAK